MMEFFKNMFSNPFVLGLLVGLVVAGLAWKSKFACQLMWKKEKKKLEQEMRDLQVHLNTQLKINATGNEALHKELEQLRSQNETLRINLAAVQQKPGKAEMRHLQITEAAVRAMREQAPGFAAAWERAMRDAEQQAEQQDSGLMKIMRKVIPTLGTTKTKSIEDRSNEENLG
jgi:hypothetical protein